MEESRSSSAHVSSSSSCCSTYASKSLDSWATTSGKGLRRSASEDKEVILRLEYMTPRELKVLVGVTWMITIGGLVALVWLYLLKLTKPVNYLLTSNTYFIVSITDAAIQLLGTVYVLGNFMYVVWQAKRTGHVWNLRRWRMSALYMTEAVVQGLNAALYLCVNLVLLLNPCFYITPGLQYFGMFRWMLWATLFFIHSLQAAVLAPFCPPEHYAQSLGRISRWLYNMRCALRPKGDYLMVIDAPAWYHWPKAIPWLAAEACTMALFINTLTHWITMEEVTMLSSMPKSKAHAICRGHIPCIVGDNFAATLYPFTASFLLLVVMYLLVVLVVWLRLRREAYVRFRTANVSFKIHVRNRLWVVLVTGLCVVVLFFVDLRGGRCEAAIFAMAGMIPMELSNGLFVLVMSWAHLPVFPRKGALLQTELREFHWTHQDDDHQAARHHAIKGCPVFCFELALKMLYWSNLVYDYEQATPSRYSIDNAMCLFNLQQYQLVWDKAIDLKALVSWGHGVVVVAFRGTDSIKNVASDLKGWRVPHPPVRGSSWLRTQPLVHNGFLKMWNDSKVKDAILGLVRGAVQEVDASSSQRGDVRILITGHSLGGALACLAAYDVHNVVQAYGSCKISCYTFGSPRVGNHAFCRDMDNAIPDTWHVINDQDVVTRSFKGLTLYKRHGQRTIINASGDIIVRPTWVEIRVYRRPGAPSMKHHLLTSYEQSLRAIVEAQFTSNKVLPGGRMSMIRLSQALATRPLFEDMLGVKYNDIKRFLLMPNPRLVEHAEPKDGTGTEIGQTEEGRAGEGDVNRTDPSALQCRMDQLRLP